MLVLVIGTLACRLALPLRAPGAVRGPVDAPASRGALDAGMLRLLGFAVLLLCASSLADLASRVLEFNGDSWHSFAADVSLAIEATHFGHIWRWRVPALCILALAWVGAKRHPRCAWLDWLMALAAAAIALTRSDTGHPADHGDFVLAVWIDWAHLMAGAVWVGSLFGMTLVVFPKLLGAGARAIELTAGLFERLSTLAGAALAGVLATGIWTALQELDRFSDLWTSAYGITLDVKVLLVLSMIAVGAHNRYVRLPRLIEAAGRPPKRSLGGALLEWTTPHRHRAGARPSAADTVADTNAKGAGEADAEIVRGCARAVLAESLIGIAVIAAASVLLHGIPPADIRTPMSMTTARAVRPVSTHGGATALGSAQPSSYTLRSIKRLYSV
ncbi:MAG: copper resistance D family protein [Steroidobacteraceae bacterium]